jgi:hypothetical protein
LSRIDATGSADVRDGLAKGGEVQIQGLLQSAISRISRSERGFVTLKDRSVAQLQLGICAPGADLYGAGPVKISRFAIDGKAPHSEFYVSPAHAIYIDRRKRVVAADFVCGHRANVP